MVSEKLDDRHFYGWRVGYEDEVRSLDSGRKRFAERGCAAYVIGHDYDETHPRAAAVPHRRLLAGPDTRHHSLALLESTRQTILL